MQTIVLDYRLGEVFILNHIEKLQIEEMETLLTEKYNFNLDEIEWMSVDDIKINYL